MKDCKEEFPIIGIQEFGKKSPNQTILYHELFGLQHIEYPHKHDFFILNLFLKGKGEHFIDFKKYQIKDHQLHLLFPGQVHEWNMDETTEGYQLMISNERLEEMMPYFNHPKILYQTQPVIDLKNYELNSLLSAVLYIREDLIQEKIQWEIVKKRTELIALMISHAAEQVFGDFKKLNEHPLLAKFYDLIDTHFNTQRSVSFYADYLNITANYLNILCRKNLNISASELIQNRILLEAKRL